MRVGWWTRWKTMGFLVSLHDERCRWRSVAGASQLCCGEALMSSAVRSGVRHGTTPNLAQAHRCACSLTRTDGPVTAFCNLA